MAQPDCRLLISAYFTAKAVQYQAANGFELRDCGPLKCLHSVPGWPELDGFYAVDVPPLDAVAAIQEARADTRHALTVFDESATNEFPEYASLGYIKTPVFPQPFMTKQLSNDAYETKGAGVSDLESSNKEEPRDVNNVIGPVNWTDGQFRSYRIEVDNQVVCWGSNMTASDGIVYIFGVETIPTYRRRGLAKVLMFRMHRDCVENGLSNAILCASPDGFALYSSLGYSAIAYMHMLIKANPTKPR